MEGSPSAQTEEGLLPHFDIVRSDEVSPDLPSLVRGFEVASLGVGKERVVWEGQPRLSAALPGVGVGVAVCTLAAAAAVFVDPRAAVSVTLGVGVMAWPLLRVRRTEYLLTTRALWLKRDVAGRSVRRVGLGKVQNTGYSRSVTGSAFGYGTVTVEVAGGDDLQFRRIDDPEAVQTAITDRTASDDEGIPGSATQWRSVLSVVREIRAGIE